MLAHDPFSRPDVMMNVHLAGVPLSAFEEVGGAPAVAGDLPHAVRSLDDCEGTFESVASLGCAAPVPGPADADALDLDLGVCAGEDEEECDERCQLEQVREIAAGAGAQFIDATEGKEGGIHFPAALVASATSEGSEDDGEFYVMSREDPVLAGVVAELSCFVRNAKQAAARTRAAGVEGGGAKRQFRARLGAAAGAREAFGAESKEALAAARLAVGAVRKAVECMHGMGGAGEGEGDMSKDGSAVSLITIPKEASPADDHHRRRRLLQATPALSKTDKFRNMATASVVAVFLLIIAACGVLAMATMTFQPDSLLYPTTKRD